MKRNLPAVIALSGFMLAGSPALAMTWQEANKESAALIVMGKLKEADSLALRAADLYARSSGYQPMAHAQLLLNRIDIVEKLEGRRGVIEAARSAIRALEDRNGPEPAASIQFVQEIARQEWGLGRFREAQLTQERLIHLNEKHFGTDSLQHVAALVGAADQIKQIKGAVDARRLLNRASEAVAGLPEGAPARAFVDIQHAKLDIETGRHGDAEARLNRLRDAMTVGGSVTAPNLLLQAYGLLAHIHDERDDVAALDAVILATRDLPAPPGKPRPLAAKVPEAPKSSSSEARGNAVIAFTVTAEGRVKDAKIVESSGNPQFAALMRDAVGRWRYQPRLQSGRPVEFQVVEAFAYSVQSDGPELGTRIQR